MGPRRFRPNSVTGVADFFCGNENSLLVALVLLFSLPNCRHTYTLRRFRWVYLHIERVRGTILSVRNLPDVEPVLDIARRLRCLRYGSRSVSTRSSWVIIQPKCQRRRQNVPDGGVKVYQSG